MKKLQFAFFSVLIITSLTAFGQKSKSSNKPFAA